MLVDTKELRNVVFKTSLWEEKGATKEQPTTTQAPQLCMVNVPKENSVFFPLVVRDGVCYEVRTVESAINFCENDLN